MRLEYRCVDALPRLAWCARLRESDDTIQVLHGPWIETWPDRFCEGAWDGPFSDGGFVDALTLTGSGGCLSNGGIVFASPTNLLARIYSVRDGNRLLVSNSLVFLLAQTDDALDITHPHYYFDFLRHKRGGLARPTSTIWTARRNRLSLHQHTNLFARSDLSRREQSKRLGPAPTDYASYREMLQSGMERVFSNASHAGRKRRYRPLATLSQGYDSPAVAALAAESGCTEALTCISPPTPGAAREDGALLGPYLGLRVSSYDRVGFRSLPGVPEAEFCAGMSYGQYVPLSVVAPTLEGTLLVTGHPGDKIWSVRDRAILPHFLEPGDQRLEGGSLAEFRLRVGFFWLPAAWIGAHHKEAIHRVTTAAEMRPWSVPGSYNRPIPRRIAEESGVPRSLFGQSKLVGLPVYLDSPDAMSAAGWHDFQAFCETRLKNRRRRHRLMTVAAAADELLFRSLQRMPHRLYLACMPLALSGLRDRRNPLWESAFLYTFHWGTEYIRSRYVM